VVRSPEVADGGTLPKDYIGDGISATLPLEWSGAPAKTTSYALIMHHIDHQGVTKWYWTLYNIPANVHSLPKNVKGVGTLGNNSINDRTEYAPPHSQGPGPKTYVYTVYALSSAPQISAPPSFTLFRTDAMVSEWTPEGGSRRPSYSLKARTRMSCSRPASSLCASRILGSVLIERTLTPRCHRVGRP
jgi:phosphatidylethanolamine-binding protein (PEBP) family uncharacterized protein